VKGLLPLLLALILVPLAAGAPSGSYTLVDGPQAGVDVHVAASGVASIIDRTSSLQYVAADDDCDQPHLHGTIEGKPEPQGGCGWGRVLSLQKATPLVRAVANAVTEEERAVSSIEQGGKPHWELALYGQLGVEHALEALAADEKAGRVVEGNANKIRNRLNAAHAIDKKVEKQMQQHTTPTDAQRASWIKQLKNALSLKREALSIAEHVGLKVADDASAPTPCAQARLDCVVSAFWDVNVPKGVKSALCVARDRASGHVTDHQHPLFAGVAQTQRCVVTNRYRTVHGVRKRVVRLTITLIGTLAGKPKPLRVAVYWPA